MFEELDDPTPVVRDPEVLTRVRARGQALRRRRQLALGTGAGATTALVAVLLLALPGGGVPDESLVPATPSVTSAPPVPTTTPPSSTASATPVPTATPTRAATATAAPAPRRSQPSSPAPEPTRPAATSSPRASGTPQAAPSPAPSRPPAASSPAAPSAPPATSARPEATLQLSGDDLGVTAVGRPRAEAVAAVRAVLGAPRADPATTVDCVEAAEEVEWAQFRLAFDGAGQVSGWSSRSTELATPSGVRVGTTVARLQQVYGDRLQLFTSEGGSGGGYQVEGVDMLGQLEGTQPGDRVVSLRNGACTGP